MITSSVEMLGGRPVLTVNGRAVDQNAYITYFPWKAQYGDFARAGFTLYSVPVFFASRTINEIGQVPPLSRGIFDEKTPDFSIADRLFADILRACPDAYIFPRVNLSLPLRWEQENPDELCDTGFTEARRPCFSSDKWAEDTRKLLGMFIDHVESAPYADRICGYQLAGGNTEEWFSFDQKGSVGKRSREKYAAYLASNGLADTEPEYYGFLSHVVASRICEFAAFTKEKTDHRLVVGAFYGYTFETTDRISCHHALNRVLKDPNVDFLCSPISYMEHRAPGLAHPYMLPLDSLKLHGKLYFAENDSRTHLTTPPFDIPHFNRPVWMPLAKWHTVENLKLHFARSLIHSHAFWWFDMWGGWYHYPLYMKMLGDFRRITGESLAKDMSGVSEVAVITDEKAFRYIRDSKGKNVCYTTGRALGLIGAPVDRYLAEDYDTIRDRYKAFIVLAPYMTADLGRIIRENPDALVITPENCSISTDELRRFCRDRGVHLYSNQDAVIYVNRSYLYLQTCSVGKAGLRLPEGRKLRQIYGDPVDIETDTLPQYEGYLFEILS